MDWVETICEAIKNRQVIKVDFRDKKFEVFEPYALIKSETGKHFVWGIMKLDAEPSHYSPGSRHIELSRIANIFPTGQTFEIDPWEGIGKLEFAYEVVCSVYGV